MKLKITLAVLSLLMLAAAGCARFPLNPGGQPKRTISFDVTVAGQINPGKYYFIAIDTDQNPLTGPLAAVAFPWGNGWGTGRISHFVEYNAGEPGRFAVYSIPEPDRDLLARQFIGNPYEGMIVNGNTLHVTLDIDTLGTTAMPAPQIQKIDVNFITTDRIGAGPKPIDGLGISGTDYITIPVVNNRIFSNTDQTPGAREAAGDMQVPDPDLDIVDWKIEVRVR